jgi:hypothetical protein
MDCQPVAEGLQLRVQLANQREVAVADEPFRVLRAVLEHVGHLDRAGKVLFAELVPRQRLVANTLAERVGEGGRVLVAGQVITGDAHEPTYKNRCRA